MSPSRTAPAGAPARRAQAREWRAALWRCVPLEALRTSSPRRSCWVACAPRAVRASKDGCSTETYRPTRRSTVEAKVVEATTERRTEGSGIRPKAEPEPGWEAEMRRLASRCGTVAPALLESKAAVCWSVPSHASHVKTAASRDVSLTLDSCH